mmetsp:Transcript_18057/g.20507  ORF Transcript_18057/g.20507 Transcript_18057/m.20507 type:complete len:81 (-) Transcript_18057:947-1189(-)
MATAKEEIKALEKQLKQLQEEKRECENDLRKLERCGSTPDILKDIIDNIDAKVHLDSFVHGDDKGIWGEIDRRRCECTIL